jgi:nitric oxide reductase NorD protein
VDPDQLGRRFDLDPRTAARLAADLGRLSEPLRARVLAGARDYPDQAGVYLRTVADVLSRLPEAIDPELVLTRAEEAATLDAEAALWYWRGVHDLGVDPRLQPTLSRFYEVGLDLTRAEARSGREFWQFTPTLLHRLRDPALPRLALDLAALAPGPEALDALRLFVDVMASLRPPRAARGWSRLVLAAARLDFEAAKVLLKGLPEMHQALGPKNLRRFIGAGLRLHRHRPVGLAAFLAVNTRRARQVWESLRPGLDLEALAEPLTAYAVSHAGRAVVLAGSIDQPPSAYAARLDWTRPERILLPARIDDPDLGPVRYRCLAALKAAQRRWGDWSEPGGPDPAAFIHEFADPDLARDLWAVFESARLDHRLKRLYPGLKRHLTRLQLIDRDQRPPMDRLSPERAVIELLDRRLRDDPWPLQKIPERIAALAGELADEARARLLTETATAQEARELTRRAYARLSRLEADPWILADARWQPPDGQPGPADAFRSRRVDEADEADEKFTGAGRVGSHHALKADVSLLAQELRRPEESPPAAEPGSGLLYDEWDFRLGAYRAAYVSLAERRVAPAAGDWARRAIDRHRSLINQLRRQWQHFRPVRAERRRKQIDGYEVDLDRYVLWRAESRAGLSPESDFYTSRHFRPRQIVSALLLDLSGSTSRVIDPDGTRVIDVAKEGFLLFTESISVSGDEFALFGYSGISRHEVDFYLIKDFGDDYDDAVQGRIAGLTPLAQNRDGAAIRHATARLLDRPARRRLLIVISDARPDDYEYDPRHGYEDTRRAIAEARLRGVYVFGVVIKKPQDRKKNPYHGLPHLTLARVSALPRVLPRLYRKLTT